MRKGMLSSRRQRLTDRHFEQIGNVLLIVFGAALIAYGFGF